MENEFFLGAGIPPPAMFEPSSSSSVNAMPTWQALSSAMEMEIQASHEWFSNPSWEKSTDQNAQFDSVLTAMASSVSNSNENSVIRELIGKLGNSGNASEISPHSQGMLAANGVYVNGNNSTNTLNSSSKLHLPKLPLNSNMADLSADPGFAERAAKFSCFGSRSFNGRTTQFGHGINNAEMNYRSNPLLKTGKLSRVSSSPSIKAMGSQLNAMEKKKNSPLQEESTVSEQRINEELMTNQNGSNELNNRKRKAVHKGKGKELASSSPSSSPVSKVSEGNDDSSAKRLKKNEGDKNENTSIKAEEEQKGNNSNSADNIEKQGKANQKPPEPPKDYIHVRARRGQATDSHSLAERVRRERISERMKLLQDLVPGCNKVTGKAPMLDEIINYVQSLQRQVEFLSMKLASVNTSLDYNADTIVSKDMYQASSSMAQPMYPLGSSATPFYSHQAQQNPSISNGMVTQCSVESLDSALCQNLEMQLPPLNGLNEVVPEFPSFCEDDLQTIVQMGFGKNPIQDPALASQTFLGPDQVTNMKVEL